MFKPPRKIQIIVIFILFLQIGFPQNRVMVKYKSNGSIFTTKISDIDTLKFNENYVEDIDGNIYKTVVIGDQVWMAENLRVTHYNDGSQIPLIVDNTLWANLNSGAYCFYDHNIYNAINYGCLYNWYAVNTEKLAPAGWHVPTDAEWTQLNTYLTNNGHSGNEGSALKSKLGWNSGGNGIDLYGLAGLPSGYRHSSFSFSGIGTHATFWSASNYNTHQAWMWYLTHDTSTMNQGYTYKKYGTSVRCIRD